MLDGAGLKVYLQRDNLGRRMREHRLMVVKYRLKENLGSKKQLATPAAQALTALKYLATKKGPLAAPVGVNGHLGIRLRGQGFSGLVDRSYSGWVPVGW